MMRKLPFVSVLLAGALTQTGCSRPPDAPATLDDLCGYLYGHFPDEDPEAMEAGLANLRAWLDAPGNLEATLEGYTVTNIDQATVDALDDAQHTVEGLAGAAIGTEGPYPPQDIAETLILVEPTELSPGIYEVYERTFMPEGPEGEANAQCFVDQDCEFLQTVNYMETTFVLGLTVATTTNGWYRWVDTEEGPAMVQRNWLAAPAELNFDWLEVDEQFYLNVVLPKDGGAVRLQATWVVARFIGVDFPEGTALDMMIRQMKSVYEDVDAWLSGDTGEDSGDDTGDDAGA